MSGLYTDLSETINKIENDPRQDIEEIKKSIRSINNRTEEMLSSVLAIEDRVNTITRVILEELLNKEMKDAGNKRT